jgi:hypothetical protein
VLDPQAASLRRQQLPFRFIKTCVDRGCYLYQAISFIVRQLFFVKCLKFDTLVRLVRFRWRPGLQKSSVGRALAATRNSVSIINLAV